MQSLDINDLMGLAACDSVDAKGICSDTSDHMPQVLQLSNVV
jgi:hypothetical protein